MPKNCSEMMSNNLHDNERCLMFTKQLSSVLMTSSFPTLTFHDSNSPDTPIHNNNIVQKSENC